MSAPAHAPTRVRTRPATTEAGEYLGSDGSGADYYARGGRVHAAIAPARDGATGRDASSSRGRFARFNRLRSRPAGPSGELAS